VGGGIKPLPLNLQGAEVKIDWSLFLTVLLALLVYQIASNILYKAGLVNKFSTTASKLPSGALLNEDTLEGYLAKHHPSILR